MSSSQCRTTNKILDCWSSCVRWPRTVDMLCSNWKICWGRPWTLVQQLANRWRHCISHVHLCGLDICLFNFTFLDRWHIVCPTFLPCLECTCVDGQLAVHLTAIVHSVPQLSLTQTDAMSYTCCVNKYECTIDQELVVQTMHVYLPGGGTIAWSDIMPTVLKL